MTAQRGKLKVSIHLWKSLRCTPWPLHIPPHTVGTTPWLAWAASHTAQGHSREPHLKQINGAEAWGSFTRLTCHWTRVVGKIFCLWESNSFLHCQFQIAEKPVLKNKTCREIDCFPAAVPVVLWGTTKLLILALGFILLFTVDFS